VEGSKFCLFSVILPAKCVSSISPRFHYRRLTFCFLPLAAILESPSPVDFRLSTTFWEENLFYGEGSYNLICLNTVSGSLLPVLAVT
jgi:hypothetical protein